MRPKSIILFERLFLASIALTLLSAFLSFDQTLAQMQADPALAALGWGSGALIVTAVCYAAFLLLLDYFIAHRASTIGKWILVLITIFSLTTLIGAFSVQSGVPLALAVLTNVLALAAVITLFFTDARAWLGAKPDAEHAE